MMSERNSNSEDRSGFDPPAGNEQYQRWLARGSFAFAGALVVLAVTLTAKEILDPNSTNDCILVAQATSSQISTSDCPFTP